MKWPGREGAGVVAEAEGSQHVGILYVVLIKMAIYSLYWY